MYQKKTLWRTVLPAYGDFGHKLFAHELLQFVFNNGYSDAARAIGYVLADQGVMAL